MTATLDKVKTLDEAIDQQINLGFGDPLEITDAVLRLYGEETVLAWLDVRTILTTSARHRLGIQRRAEEASALTAKHAGARAAAMRDGRCYVWIPGKGSVRSDELTAEDCLTRAEHLHALAQQNATKADLYETIASVIRANGVATLGELPQQEVIKFVGRLADMEEAA